MVEWKQEYGLKGYSLQGAIQELTSRGMHSQADKLKKDPLMRSLNTESIGIIKKYMAGRRGVWK